MNPSNGSASPGSQAEAMVSLVLGPLMTQIEAQRQTIERQSDQLISQAEIIGQLRAERTAQAEALARLTVLAPSYSPGATESEPEAPEPRIPPFSPFPAPIPPTTNVAPWWQRRRSWLAAGLLVAVVGSASCQTAPSVKHPGLCSAARATMDFWSKAADGQPLPDGGFWGGITSAVDVAQKVC